MNAKLRLSLSLLLAAAAVPGGAAAIEITHSRYDRPRHSAVPKDKRPVKRVGEKKPDTPPKPSAPTGEVTRGVMKVIIKVGGTVRAEDLFRMKSSIEGRVEHVYAKTQTWYPAGKALVSVLNTEMAALRDSESSISPSITEERWKTVYRPTPARCPVECYVLRIFARPNKWIKPQAILVEAARKLRMIGRTRPGDGHWIKKGQLLTYWDVKNPRKRYQTRLKNFQLDVQGERAGSAGTFSILFTSKRYLPPDTKWEGEIEALVRKNVLKVPTSALIQVNGQTYLPIRVSTGITTSEFTEITSGIPNHQKYLHIEAAKREGLKPHAPPPATLDYGPDVYTEARPQARARKRMRKKRRRESLNFDPPTIRKRKKQMPVIDVFPDDLPDEEDKYERFPSDLH